MAGLIVVVFITVFALVALIVLVKGGPKTSKQTRATLDSVLKTESQPKREKAVDVRKDNRLSAIPWVHDLLTNLHAATELQRLLDQADLAWTPARLILTSIAFWIVSVFFFNARMRMGWGAALLALAPAALPYIYVMKKRAKRFRAFQQKLPEALDLMVSALRAGHSMIGAFGTAAKESPEPIGREFRTCFEEQNFGIDMREALQSVVNRVPLQDVRMITIAMLINKESGGNLAEVLDKTAHIIRERFRLQQQIRVHTAQGRLTGWVLSLLPFVLGIILYTINPGYMSLLFTNPSGRKALLLAGTANLIGLMVIRKIVNVKV